MAEIGGGGGGGCCPPMDLMRSEPMQLVQVIVPMESAHLTVSYLGDLGLVQFKDVRLLLSLSLLIISLPAIYIYIRLSTVLRFFELCLICDFKFWIHLLMLI